MHPFPPSEFAKRWPGTLRAIHFAEPKPMLPKETLDGLIEFGLPREVTIRCYNDIVMGFSGSATPLAVIWNRDLKRGYKMGAMPREMGRFWHLADEEYLQGGGWVCIEEVTARLVVIDLDLPKPVYLLNSTVDRFLTTLGHFVDWSERTNGSKSEIRILRSSLLHQRIVPVDELEPFWFNLIDATLDSDSKLAVSLAAQFQ